jgi:hypothetical protein
MRITGLSSGVLRERVRAKGPDASATQIQAFVDARVVRTVCLFLARRIVFKGMNVECKSWENSVFLQSIYILSMLVLAA